MSFPQVPLRGLVVHLLHPHPPPWLSGNNGHLSLLEVIACSPPFSPQQFYLPTLMCSHSPETNAQPTIFLSTSAPLIILATH